MATSIKQLDTSLQERFIEVTQSGDDAGVKFTGQVSVGEPGAGKEAVFGAGDSYPVGQNGSMVFHFDYGNLTGTTITGATDITTILSSESGSTTGLFGGTAVDSAVLVGSDVPFGGVKVKIDTLGTVEPANVISEYLQNSTPTWTRSFYMATDADYPYTQKGNSLATCSSCSEQWRFGFDPENLPVPWDAVELTINGTAYTKYWGLFRVTSIITSDPILEQMKLHTNRHEINADGFTEYFGRARYQKSINATIEPNANFTPSNENVKIAPNITATRVSNKLRNTAKDGLILRGLFPVGIDTSVPIILVVDWYPDDNTAGEVELALDLVVKTDDFVYDGAAAVLTATPVVTSVNNNLEKSFVSIFKVVAQTALPGDTVYGSLTRDASGTRVNDTYTGDVVIADAYVLGYFWTP